MAKKATVADRPMTKTQLFAAISDTTGLKKTEIASVFDSLNQQIAKSIGRRGVGAISLPGLVKIDKRKIPARPARKGVRNPFTGDLMDVAAKKASTKVRVRALKNLKDMI